MNARRGHIENGVVVLDAPTSEPALIGGTDEACRSLTSAWRKQASPSSDATIPALSWAIAALLVGGCTGAEPVRAPPAQERPPTTSGADEDSALECDYEFYVTEVERGRDAPLDPADGEDIGSVSGAIEQVEAIGMALIAMESLDGIRDACGVEVPAELRVGSALERANRLGDRLLAMMEADTEHLDDATQREVGEVVHSLSDVFGQALRDRDAVRRSATTDH